MFYNSSEAEFPNWWDDLEGDRAGGSEGQESQESPASGSSGLSGEERFSRGSPDRGLDTEFPAEESGNSSRVREEGTPGPGAGVYEREALWRIWEYGEAVPGNDADLWRKDEFGNWIHRLDYGNRSSEFGWEVFDPGIGRYRQGIYVMRPMQWQSYLSAFDILGS